MTIFRCDLARAMLLDVFATWDDWHAELGTVTGFDWTEYQALHHRLSQSAELTLSKVDESMLTQAANQFFGYPAIQTSTLEAVIGREWGQHLTDAFRKRRD